MDIMKSLFPDIDTEDSSLQAVDTILPEVDLTLSIVTSRAKKTELRLKNMKQALSRELDPEKRSRLRAGIAEHEIRLDELRIIERAAGK